MTIAERIADLRELRGLKQYQLAEAIGVTRATMCKYERGTNIPDADYLCGLSNDFNPYDSNRIYVDGTDKELVQAALALSRDNKLRLCERARIMLEQQK